MSDAGRGEPRGTGNDADLLAIRALIAETAAETMPEPSPPRVGKVARRQQRSVAAQPAARPAFADPVRPVEPARKELRSGLAARLRDRAVSKIRSYRPNTKTVLGTSLVLLLLLHPLAFIGWCVVAAILALAFYLIIGEDRFWRGVVAAHVRFAGLNPVAARRLKVRARLVARRWDRWIAYLPAGMADVLRSPDVRALVLAEKRHDAVLSDRLSRLG